MLRVKTCLLALVLSLLGSAKATDHFAKPGPVELTKEGRRWAEQTLKKLTLEEKVGQLLSVRYFMDFENFESDAYRQFRDQMQKYHLGSVVLTVHVDGPSLLKSLPLEAAAMSNQLQRDSKLPLLIAADFERGLGMRMSSVPIFPDAMAFGATGDPKNAERFGAIVAEESRAVGVQWDFWPTADVNVNPQNPIINTRSYGEDPAAVGEFAAAFIRGARSHGMLTSVKHFPGHGDTGTDSHLGVARVDADLARLQSVELPPFRQAIAAGADSVMVAHLATPALEPDQNKVATISSNVIQGVLRKQLGFEGVIVTDAMEMRGLTGLYSPQAGNPAGRAAVDALKAGNDVLLLPSDLDGAYRGVLDAVRRGDLTEKRLDESVRRVLEMKASVGLNKARLVDLEQVSHMVSRQADLDFAQQVADQAVTIVRSNGKVIPLTELTPAKTENEFYPAPASSATQLVTIIISDNAHGAWGRNLELAIRSRRADATVFYVDASLATPLAGVILQAVKDAGKVVVATYVSPVSGKQVTVNGKLVNSVGLQPAAADLLNQILEAAAAKTVVAALGNPYIILNFPLIQNYVCSFSGQSSSELSVAKVLFGEMQPGGVLPITLPGVAERGMKSLTLAKLPAVGR
ncbi:MAG TPA: glycoside hydrolase family 3 N-terminal domain-containing protein [Candidatus Limnocylindrales bacterium]|nr:glycoside hydrolase family 3 N-terminal domain-containing protein [Candidatus Limnocylindrales bacterium]